MLHVLKRIGLFLAIGGVLGDVLTMILAPSFLTWFHTPGTGSALCNCADVSRETASALVNAQLSGTAMGAMGFALIGELIVRLWDARKKQGERAALAAAQPAPAPALAPAEKAADAAVPTTTEPPAST